MARAGRSIRSTASGRARRGGSTPRSYRRSIKWPWFLERSDDATYASSAPPTCRRTDAASSSSRSRQARWCSVHANPVTFVIVDSDVEDDGDEAVQNVIVASLAKGKPRAGVDVARKGTAVSPIEVDSDDSGVMWV